METLWPSATLRPPSGYNKLGILGQFGRNPLLGNGEAKPKVRRNNAHPNNGLTNGAALARIGYKLPVRLAERGVAVRQKSDGRVRDRVFS